MNNRIILVFLLLVLFPVVSFAKMAIPSIQGIEVIEGSTSVMTEARDTQAFRFSDGRIVADPSSWSSDSGLTWRNTGVVGPGTGGYKMAIDLGAGEILSIYRTPARRADGTLYFTQERSFNNWVTKVEEKATVSVPLAVPLGGDACDTDESPLMHHGIIKLKNGDLMATAYGNYIEDDDLVPVVCTRSDGTSYSFSYKKYRMLVLFSSDKGKTWGSPITVAHSKMIDPTTGTKYVAHEGFGEGALTRASNGDILIFMRSGGINSNLRVAPTPLYMSRSRDEGKTWSAPVKVAEFGANPEVITLSNGIIALTYGGGDAAGGRIQFSDDNGITWKGSFQVTRSSSYTAILPLGTDKILVLYYSADHNAFAATSFTAKKKSDSNTVVNFSATPASLTSGGSSMLNWSATNARNCVLSGGAWGTNGVPASVSNSNISTGSLTQNTTYKLKCESVATPRTFVEKSVTVSTALPVSVSLTATPTTIVSGSSATLAWSGKNVRNCMLFGGTWGNNGVSVSSVSSASTGALTTSTSYAIKCENVSRASSHEASQVSVLVTPASQPQSVSLNTSSSNVSAGSAGYLSWNASNSRNCVLSGGAWSPGIAVGTINSNTSTGALFQNTTYSLKCESVSTSGIFTEKSVSINVVLPVVPPMTNISLTAVPTSVNSGSASGLSWSATNARNCVLSGGAWNAGASVGSVNSNISTGSLTQNTTYKLKCESTATAGTFTEKTIDIAVNPVKTPDPEPVSTTPAIPTPISIPDPTPVVPPASTSAIISGGPLVSVSTTAPTPVRLPDYTLATSLPATVNRNVTAPVAQTVSMNTQNLAPQARIKTSTKVNVRTSPSVVAKVLKSKPTGSAGVLTGEQMASDGYLWKKVIYDDGVSGWTVQDFLQAESSSQNTSLNSSTVSTVPTGKCPIITRNLFYGLSGSDVFSLQEFLISKKMLTGPSTGYFGTLTKEAVQKWQSQKNLVSYGEPSTTGYGMVGPKTRKALTSCND